MRFNQWRSDANRPFLATVGNRFEAATARAAARLPRRRPTRAIETLRPSRRTVRHGARICPALGRAIGSRGGYAGAVMGGWRAVRVRVTARELKAPRKVTVAARGPQVRGNDLLTQDNGLPAGLSRSTRA